MRRPGAAAPAFSNADMPPFARCKDWQVYETPQLCVAPLTLDKCLNKDMTKHEQDARVVRADREIAAPAGQIFELIAEPVQQPRWDGNDNLVEAPEGQRVRAVGDVFTMKTTKGKVRENHVVEFEEGRLIAWRPAGLDEEPPGHLWRWELEPVGPSRTRVIHTYDWTQLTDEKRVPRARATTRDRLQDSLDRLAALAEHG